MRKLVICVRELPNQKCEIGAYEEVGKDGTELEAGIIATITEGMAIVVKTIGKISKDCETIDIEHPTEEMRKRMEAYFSRSTGGG